MDSNTKNKLIILVRVLSVIVLIGEIIFFISIHRTPTAEILIVSFALMLLPFNKGILFLKDWWPLLFFFFLYENTRGRASLIQALLHIDVHKDVLVNWETLIFGDTIPTIVFQKFTNNHATIIDIIAIFMYSSFFGGPFTAGLILWIKSQNKWYKVFMTSYLVLCYMGLITYILLPAYPPWAASEAGLLPYLERPTWKYLGLGRSLSIAFRQTGYNPYAPMPSLHAGWSTLTAFLLDEYFKKQWGLKSKIFYLYPAAMYFTIIYTADHFVVDIIAGIIYAAVALWIGLHYKEISTFIRKLLHRKKKAS